MNLQRIALSFALLLALALSYGPQTANAQIGANIGGDLGLNLSGGYGVHHIFGGRSLHEFARTIPRAFGGNDLPYFALFPPVYYSHVVPRPYGYSPFALPPGVQPAEAIAGPPEEATEIINPFYHPNDEEKQSELTEEVAMKSKMILNPFVDQQNIANAIPETRVLTLRQARLRK